MNGFYAPQTRRRLVGASLLAFTLTLSAATITRADMLFDDDENGPGPDDDDSGSNSRVENHRLHHTSLAELVTSSSYIEGIGFITGTNTKRK